METLVIPKELLSEMLAHCKEIFPNEACGILAGKGNVVQRIYKMTNIEKSGVSYMMDPGEQFTVMKEMRENGLEMTAIYHSHPEASAYPSAKDISLAFYPDSLYVIASLIDEAPAVKAFEIKDGTIREAEILII